MIRRRRLTTVAAVAVLLGSGGVAVTAGQAVPDATPAAVAKAITPLPKPDHVVIVVLENKRYDAVIGHPKTPWISSLAERWANMTRFYAQTHPSQPNYLALFSGSTHGVTDNNCPHNLGDRPNLGRQLIDAGYTFTGYSEDLPRVGFTGCISPNKQYVRRHNPWVNFSNVPATANQPYTKFPTDYRKLPTVSFVVPNLCHGMHDCPKAKADAWLNKEFAPYISWAMKNNSLFILTFDEDNRTGGNRIPTIVAGAGVKPGQYAPRLDHYHLLRTLQEIYGLTPTGYAAKRPPLRGLWTGA
jgi:hypothetical protein